MNSSPGYSTISKNGLLKMVTLLINGSILIVLPRNNVEIERLPINLSRSSQHVTTTNIIDQTWSGCQIWSCSSLHQPDWVNEITTCNKPFSCESYSYNTNYECLVMICFTITYTTKCVMQTSGRVVFSNKRLWGRRPSCAGHENKKCKR